MRELTAEGRERVAEIGRRHGVGEAAAAALMSALAAGHGTQAQFDHPDLGGMGQWSRGGMIMVGDMFNSGLKARVDALCTELAGLLDRAAVFAPAPRGATSSGEAASLFVPGGSAAGTWWPEGLGVPGSTGAQDDLRYAFFPAARRLAIARAGAVTVHDTGDHRLGGFSQQQGGGQTLSFTSQHGPVRLADLPEVGGPPEGGGPAPARDAADEVQRAPPRDAADGDQRAPPRNAPDGVDAADGDIFVKIERLAELHRKDILTAEEFAAKKAELLARL